MSEKLVTEEYLHVSKVLGFDGNGQDLALEIAKLADLLHQIVKAEKIKPKLIANFAMTIVLGYVTGRGKYELLGDQSFIVGFIALLNDFYNFTYENHPERE